MDRYVRVRASVWERHCNIQCVILHQLNRVVFVNNCLKGLAFNSRNINVHVYFIKWSLPKEIEDRPKAKMICGLPKEQCPREGAGIWVHIRTREKQAEIPSQTSSEVGLHSEGLCQTAFSSKSSSSITTDGLLASVGLRQTLHLDAFITRLICCWVQELVVFNFVVQYLFWSWF